MTILHQHGAGENHPCTDWAHKYARSGMRVLPLRSKSKQPAVKDWPNQATTDPEQIQAWFADNSSNLGLAMGPWRGGDTYLVAIDLDVHHADQNGLQAWEQLVATHGDMGSPFIADTATGGRHLLYQSPVPLTNERGALPAGIDVRGEGGQIMVQPSIHPETGTSPTWRPGTDWENSAPGLIPQWLLELIQAKPAALVVPEYVRPPRQSNDPRPGDNYNRTHTWAQVLTADGWTPIGDNKWLRPGKQLQRDQAPSAVLYPEHGEHGVLVVFSTNAPAQLLRPQFATTTGGHYKLTSPWAYEVAMRHGGDFVAAARMVAQQTRQDNERALGQLTGTDSGEPSDLDEPRPDLGHTWRLKPLSDLIGVPYEPRLPRLLRIDGEDTGLFYGDAHNLVAAPSGVGKSWIQAIVCLQEIQQGNHVVVIDYEMQMRDWFQRLQILGATQTELGLVHYCAPDEPLSAITGYEQRGPQPALGVLVEELQRISELGNLTWVAIDGVTNAMTAQSMKLLDNQHVAEFWRLLPQRIVNATGAGVGLNDHVPRNAKSDTAAPLGAQHKVAATSGSAFTVRNESVLALRPAPHDGVLVMRCIKDRHGQVGQQHTEVAQVILSPDRKGNIRHQVLRYHSDALSMMVAERDKVWQAVAELNAQGIAATLNKVADCSGITNKTTCKQQLLALAAQGRAQNRGSDNKQNWFAIQAEPDYGLDF